MKKNIMSYVFEIIGIIIILFSAPLGYLSIELFFIKQGHYLSNEYFNILDGFIHSFIVTGVLLFVFGLYQFKKNNIKE